MLDGGTAAGGASPLDAGVAGASSGGATQTSDWSACTSRDACVLEPAGPCGVGCEPIPLSAYVALNRANVDAYRQSQPPAPCVGMVCSELANSDIQSQNFYAQCVGGRCRAFDVRTTELSRCEADSDCRLRAGTTCCGCGDEHLIAYASQANVEAVFCAPQSGCAADCVPPPLPRFVAAWCTAGQCVVHYPP